MHQIYKWQSVSVLIVGLGIIISAVKPMIFAATPQVAQTTAFSDIKGNWSQSCITRLASQGLIAGYPDGTFRPNASVTRAEFAAMLNKAFPNAKKTRNATRFVDIPSSYWANGAIAKASQTGFLSGYPGGVFKPSQNIPRAQVLVALVSGLNYSLSQSPSITLANFADAKTIPKYANNGVAAATQKRLVVNYPNVKYLRPNQSASRADVSAFLCQALDKPGQASGVPEQFIAGSNTGGNGGVNTGSFDYYVSSNGSDNGRGTKSSPWRTLNKALTSVPAGRQVTIGIGPGTFDLGGKVSVPSGVKLVGSGIDATTIMGEMRLVKVNDVTISKLQLNGNKYKYSTALFIRDAKRLNIENVAFNKYESQAIEMERISDSEFAYLDIFDCTFNKRKAGGGGTQSRAIDLGNLTNVNIHNVTINTLTRGGQGIGSNTDKWKAGIRGPGTDGIFRNVKLYNLDIKVDAWNAWQNGWTPQMALELYSHKCYGCEVYNSTFNSTVSLAVQPTKEPVSIRVHHNLWYGNNPYYACEVTTDNIEFDHNYIRGGSYSISSFGNKYRNLNVHHNVFEKTKGPFLIGILNDKRENFKFTNNTIYISDKKSPLFRFKNGQAPNQQISNNIFYSPNKINNSLGISIGLENNLFYNIKPGGDRPITVDPQLRLSGSVPSPYYMPKNGSPADSLNLGAIQPGSSAWVVGKR
ncbi:MAG: S-layer homology domain-containing protein [Desmonostoc vinosum HA7617-LM4]|jgi:hypothetical protein|nr:S-layer homology domain-containing protein [Desmonostoc vinosum HA7617-LM4]